MLSRRWCQGKYAASVKVIMLRRFGDPRRLARTASISTVENGDVVQRKGLTTALYGT